MVASTCDLIGDPHTGFRAGNWKIYVNPLTNFQAQFYAKKELPNIVDANYAIANKLGVSRSRFGKMLHESVPRYIQIIQNERNDR